jgi:hypothetical protein
MILTPRAAIPTSPQLNLLASVSLSEESIIEARKVYMCVLPINKIQVLLAMAEGLASNTVCKYCLDQLIKAKVIMHKEVFLSAQHYKSEVQYCCKILKKRKQAAN